MFSWGWRKLYLPLLPRLRAPCLRAGWELFVPGRRCHWAISTQRTQRSQQALSTTISDRRVTSSRKPASLGFEPWLFHASMEESTEAARTAVSRTREIRKQCLWETWKIFLQNATGKWVIRLARTFPGRFAHMYNNRISS